MGDPVLKCQLGVAREAVAHEREALVAFGIGGTLEEFIQDARDDVRGGEHITRHALLVRRFLIQ